MHAQPAIGRFEGLEHRFPVRVYFEDTDVSGVVYHANYLRFLERARSDMLLCAHVDHAASVAAGEGAFVVRSAQLGYRVPARLADDLTVASTLVKLRAASSLIHQRVMRGSTIVVEAEIELAFVTPDGRPRRQPAAWVAAFEPYLLQEI
jgi:acyl-CoA thioester hydrolase